MNKIDLNQQLTNDLFNEMGDWNELDYYVDVEYSIWDWERLWMNSYGEMDYDELIDEYYDGNPPTLKQLIKSVISNVDGGLWEIDWFFEMMGLDSVCDVIDSNSDEYQMWYDRWDKMVCEINTRLENLK